MRPEPYDEKMDKLAENERDHKYWKIK